MSKLFVVIIAFCGGLLVISNNKTVTSADLPPYQRTAIHAPAVATRTAGNIAADSAEAQAAAFEQESALVYAQAQERQGAQLRTLATQAAAVSTQTANDTAVSAEYATLVAIQIDATRQAITQTMEQNRKLYDAGVVSIQATKQAVYKDALDKADIDDTSKSINKFWMYFWPGVAVLASILFFVTLWRLSNRITPRYIEVENDPEPSAPQVQWDVRPAPPSQPVDAAKVAARVAAYNMAVKLVEDSIRQNGGRSDKFISAADWESLGNSRDNHTIALSYLKDAGSNGASLIRTQQGGPPDKQGTYVQESGKDLVYLLRVLSTTPPP